MSNNWLSWYSSTVSLSSFYQKPFSHRDHKSLVILFPVDIYIYHYQFDHVLRARDETIVASGLDLVGPFDENLDQMIETWAQIVTGKISQNKKKSSCVLVQYD